VKHLHTLYRLCYGQVRGSGPSRPDWLAGLGVVNHVVSIGVELASVNTISNNASPSMLPQVMPAAVQVLRLYRQNVVGIQMSSHLQRQTQGLHIMVILQAMGIAGRCNGQGTCKQLTEADANNNSVDNNI